MDQKTFYKYSTIALLLINVALLVFILISPKPTFHQRQHPPQIIKSKLAGILDLNDKQTKEFDALAEDHNAKLTEIKEKQEGVIIPYFDGLLNTNALTNKDSALAAYQKLEREKLEVTYNHLIDIKKLLDQNQTKNFESFMEIFKEKVLIKKKTHRPPPSK